MFFSIRWRLVGSYLLLTLITTLALGLILLSILDSYFLQQEKAHLLENAKALASCIPRMRVEQGLEQLQPLVSAYGLLSQAHVCLLDEGERPLLDSWEELPGKKLGFSLLESRRGSGELEIGLESLSISSSGQRYPALMVDARSPWGGYTIVEKPAQARPTAERPLLQRVPTPLYIEVKVPIQDANGTWGYVQMSRAATRGQQLLQMIRSALSHAGLLALALAVAMGLAISRSLTAPLQAVARTAQAMAEGDLAVRAPVGRWDEIGQLAARFNHMAERLQQTFAALAADRDALRRFAADASHELRTPITALKTFNELLLGQAQGDPAARQEFLVESQAQIERLDWLTHNLLQLSRLDSGLLEMDWAEHDLVELARSVVMSFLPQAEEKELNLQTEFPSGAVFTKCDRQRIEQVLSNLLSNALKFTPAGGRITVGIVCYPDSAEVWVEDTGIGIAAEDLPRVFERFYRAKGHTEAGSGLGLAIAQAIVQAHGGQIGVSSQPGRGSRFSFRLPLSPIDARL